MGIMTRRFYYADPLAAAWMAKYFGMKYEPESHVHALSRLTDALQQSYTCKIYIKQESLSLLEPKAGDLVLIWRSWCAGLYDHPDAAITGDIEGRSLFETIVCATDDCARSLKIADYQPHEGWWVNQSDAIQKIVQRNDIAFMWPASEKA
jgi:hypothetical protein